jgi:NAD-dependent SIR2 family protein deacetylase
LTLKTRRCVVCGTVYTAPPPTDDEDDDQPSLCPLCEEMITRDDD